MSNVLFFSFRMENVSHNVFLLFSLFEVHYILSDSKHTLILNAKEFAPMFSYVRALSRHTAVFCFFFFPFYS